MESALKLVGFVAMIVGSLLVLRGMWMIAAQQSVKAGIGPVILGFLCFMTPALLLNTAYFQGGTSDPALSAVASSLPEGFETAAKTTLSIGAMISEGLWAGGLQSKIIYIFAAGAVAYLIMRNARRGSIFDWFVDVIVLMFVMSLAFGPGSTIPATALRAGATATTAVSNAVEQAFNAQGGGTEVPPAGWESLDVTIAQMNAAALPETVRPLLFAVAEAASPISEPWLVLDDQRENVIKAGVISEAAETALGSRPWAYSQSAVFNDQAVQRFLKASWEDTSGRKVSALIKGINQNLSPAAALAIVHSFASQNGRLRVFSDKDRHLGIVMVSGNGTDVVTATNAAIKAAYKKEYDKYITDQETLKEKELSATIDEESPQYEQKLAEAKEEVKKRADELLGPKAQPIAVLTKQALVPYIRDVYLRELRSRALSGAIRLNSSALAGFTTPSNATGSLGATASTFWQSVIDRRQRDNPEAWAALTLTEELSTSLPGTTSARVSEIAGTSANGWQQFIGGNPGLLRQAVELPPKPEEGKSMFESIWNWVIGFLAFLTSQGILALLEAVSKLLMPIATLFLPWFCCGVLMILLGVGWPIVSVAALYRPMIIVDWVRASFWVCSWVVFFTIGACLVNASGWMREMTPGSGMFFTGAGGVLLQEGYDAAAAKSIGALSIKLMGWGLMIAAPSLSKLILNPSIDGLAALAGVSTYALGPGTVVSVAQTAAATAAAVVGGPAAMAAVSAMGGKGDGGGGAPGGAGAEPSNAKQGSGGGGGGDGGAPAMGSIAARLQNSASTQPAASSPGAGDAGPAPTADTASAPAPAAGQSAARSSAPSAAGSIADRFGAAQAAEMATAPLEAVGGGDRGLGMKAAGTMGAATALASAGEIPAALETGMSGMSLALRAGDAQGFQGSLAGWSSVSEAAMSSAAGAPPSQAASIVAQVAAGDLMASRVASAAGAPEQAQVLIQSASTRAAAAVELAPADPGVAKVHQAVESAKAASA